MIFKTNNMEDMFFLKNFQIQQGRYNSIRGLLQKIGNFNGEVLLHSEGLDTFYVIDKDNKKFFFSSSSTPNNNSGLDPFEVKMIDKNAIISFSTLTSKKTTINYFGVFDANSELIVAHNDNPRPKYVKYRFKDIEYSFYTINREISINANVAKAILDKNNQFATFFNLLRDKINSQGDFIITKGRETIGKISISQNQLKEYFFKRGETVSFKNGVTVKEQYSVDDVNISQLENKMKSLLKNYIKKD